MSQSPTNGSSDDDSALPVPFMPTTVFHLPFLLSFMRSVTCLPGECSISSLVCVLYQGANFQSGCHPLSLPCWPLQDNLATHLPVATAIHPSSHPFPCPSNALSHVLPSFQASTKVISTPSIMMFDSRSDGQHLQPISISPPHSTRPQLVHSSACPLVMSLECRVVCIN